MNTNTPIEIMDAALPIVAVVMGSIVAMVIMVTYNVRRGFERRAIEASRRELGAYVAEGTMNIDQAERLLDAGPQMDDEPSRRRR